MRAFVTGSEGFVGKHLVTLLESQGHTVYGFDIKNGEDLRDYDQVRTAIDFFRPDWIFHIAALAYVPESFLDPRRAIETNTIGSLNVLEAVRNIGLKAKIHMAGTSEEYGDHISTTEITELTLPNPLSPYAIAKLAMTHLGRLYAESYNMNVVITRTFNHTGPGRGEQYAEAAFAKQIVEIERGTRKVLEHGNLDAVRNYTDVRDVVRAYVQAITLPSGVYNVCTDQNVSIREVLRILMDLAQTVITTVDTDSLYRPVDFSFKKPSCHKFINATTDWMPTISLKQSLADILDEWRGKL